ncbi:MAG: RluA family pseudouridine synthase [Firmicutes bacterium]|nr:RluA family pseudouridine synthase [Bacillota bacterium]
MEEIKVNESGKRLDQFLMEQTEYSRSKIQKMIQEGIILVNDTKVKNSYRVSDGDIITIDEYEEDVLSAEPEDIPLNIVYEDEDILVINKENGMVVHPAVGNNHGTLVNALCYYSKNLSDLNGEFRPGIVHRIDAETTGLLVVAKTNEAHASLAEQLKNKTTHRKYVALCWGVIEEDSGDIIAPIGRDGTDRKKMKVTDKNAKDAVTHFKVLERFQDATMVELELETGRTHQIRVHMDYIGHPIINDKVYGRRKRFDETGQCLHAKTLGFVHPRTKQYMEFDSELPACFLHILNQLEK